MKGKLSITGKRVSMILLGASLMCLLSSCAVNDKSKNYENVSDEIETVDLNEIDNEEQHSATENEKEQDTISQVTETLRSRVQNGCTGCRYCMPCPAGVNIPGCFSAWNTYHMYQNYNVVKWSWENGIGDEHQPKNCIQCGKCEAQCPQKIAIREDLKKVQADLDKKERC